MRTSKTTPGSSPRQGSIFADIIDTATVRLADQQLLLLIASTKKEPLAIRLTIGKYCQYLELVNVE